MVDNCKIKNPKSKSGFTPLHAAASNGHLEIVKYKELNHFGAIAAFFRDLTPGTLQCQCTDRWRINLPL